MTTTPITRRSALLRLTIGSLLGALLIILVGRVLAQPAPQVTPAGQPVIHPAFPLLDASGANVLRSAQPISTLQTCGGCHDAAFISRHSFHSDVGLTAFGPAGSSTGGRSWDSSPGLFGRWDPLLYRYLSPQGDAVVDLTTPEWVQVFGARHVGGGPAATSRDGRPLTAPAPSAADVETAVRDPRSGQLSAWDWSASGVVEMNCFLCHTRNPDNAARTAALQAGAFGWANTATLLGSGVVEQTAEGFRYNPAAFDALGNLRTDSLTMQDPTNANCGQCHGVVHTDVATPLTLNPYDPGDYTTLTTGQIIAPGRIAQSGLNLSAKNDLQRTWDVHSERVLNCTNCHYALNNPVYFQGSPDKQPEHLTFDPRRLDISDYLLRPLHEFAKGQSAQSSLASGYDNTLRRCESCHSTEKTHNWLPYKEAHNAAVACESCHVPQLYAPALQAIDWTALQADGRPLTVYRGTDERTLQPTSFTSGYTPILLPQQDADGRERLAPFNLVTAWYWVYGEPRRPVPLAALQVAYFDDVTAGRYAAPVLAAFDANGDGALDAGELTLDNSAKTAVIAERLAAAGLSNPAVQGDVQPYGIHHNVTTKSFATRDCRACHGEASLAAQPLSLAPYAPGGATPTLLSDNVVRWTGGVTSDGSGGLLYEPRPAEAGLYLFGHHAVAAIDWLGALMFLGVLGGAAVHGGLRYRSARQRRAHAAPAVQSVYMYDVYERFWHWLQTVTILILIATGLIIHKPDTFGIFSFSYVVQVHNIVAAILVINAALSLFYHLVSGEIRQFLPRPYGFFDQAIEQAKFYLGGIFRGDPHPFEKTRQRKLNPLQQLTYFAILNILLPLQVLTGALMWGAQTWPTWSARLGGLPFLAPFHTLVAWSFASFIVMHVYLTTTGHTPLAAIRAMMLGWDEVEVATATAAAPAAAASPAAPSQAGD